MGDGLQHVLSHYDVGRFKHAHRVEQGFVNENWVVETERGRYFLKRRHPDLRDPVIISAQHALMAYLRRAGFPAPRVLSTADGATLLFLEDECYEMQEYIAGAPYDHRRPEHLEEAARTLGRYHVLVRGFAAPALDRGDLYSPVLLRANLGRLIDAWGLGSPEVPPDVRLQPEPLPKQGVRPHDEIARLEAHADDLAARFAEHGTLPYLSIHGDYYAGNLLFAGDRIVGVVDYDKARRQPRVVEMAEALIYFASPRPGHLRYLVYPGFLQWAPFARFLREYARIVRLDECEAHALPDYVRCIWLQVALQRLCERGLRPAWAQEALQEVLALGEWAEANARQMSEIANA